MTWKTRGGKNSRDAIRMKADGYSNVSKIENDYRLSIWKAKVEVRLERGKSKSLGDTTLSILCTKGWGKIHVRSLGARG